MTPSQTIMCQISPFGSFRQYMSAPLSLKLEKNSTIQTLRETFFSMLVKNNPDFQNKSLIEASVFALGAELLEDDFLLEENCELSILPPVCGG